MSSPGVGGAVPVGETGRLAFGSVLTVFAVGAIVLNGITIAVFSRINRMFKNYFLGTRALIINLAIADIIMVVFYSLPTIIVSFGGGQWLLGDFMCQFQILVVNTICAMNMHMLAALTVERFIRFFHPKLHEIIFTDTTMFILLFGLWIFDIVIGILPVIGWGAIVFYNYELQCSFDYILSVSYQSFSFIVIFLLPMLLAIVLTVAIAIKIRLMIQAHGNSEGIQLGEESETRDTYITKLVKLQIYLASLPRKRTKASIKKRVGRRAKVQDPTEDGYGSDSSSDEEVAITHLRKNEKKVFKFRRSEYVLAMTYMACSITIFLLWFMYIVLNYMNTNSLTIQISSTLWLVSVFLTHGCIICKPVIYFAQNYKFRYALIYGLKPWLFEEEPIDLREELSADKEKKEQDKSTTSNDVEGTEAYTNYAYEPDI